MADPNANDQTGKIARAASSAFLERYGDRIIGGFLAVALSVGAYFAASVREEVRDTRSVLSAEVLKVSEKLQGIADRTTVLEAARFGQSIADHETRLRELEKRRTP